MAKSPLYKIVAGHLADDQAFHKGMLERHEEDTPEHAFHKSAVEAAAEKMALCEKSEVAESLAKRTHVGDGDLNKMEPYIRETMIRETIGNMVVPTNVSGVTPNRPDITAVPRNGQPAVPTAPNVPLEFQKVFSVEDD